MLQELYFLMAYDAGNFKMFFQQLILCCLPLFPFFRYPIASCSSFFKRMLLLETHDMIPSNLRHFYLSTFTLFAKLHQPCNYSVIASILKRPRTPSANNLAMDYQTADSEHAFKRARPFGVSEEVLNENVPFHLFLSWVLYEDIQFRAVWIPRNLM